MKPLSELNTGEQLTQLNAFISNAWFIGFCDSLESLAEANSTVIFKGGVPSMQHLFLRDQCIGEANGLRKFKELVETKQKHLLELRKRQQEQEKSPENEHTNIGTTSSDAESNADRHTLDG